MVSTAAAVVSGALAGASSGARLERAPMAHGSVGGLVAVGAGVGDGGRELG